MMAGSTQVGFVGLGNMGRYMAANLGRRLVKEKIGQLNVWNRTSAKSQDLVEETGGEVKAVDSLEDIAHSCDVIFTSLANDDVVKSVFSQLLSSAKAGTLFIETSTIFPEVAKELEKEVQSKQCHFVAALPFGQPPVAKTAQLVFAIGGQEEAVKRATEMIVPAIGRKTMEFGQDPSKASTFKLIGNSIILSTVEMMSESMTLAEKTGIGADRVLEWVELFYPAPSAINYGNKVANLKFEATGGFDLHGGLKDAKHIGRLGDQAGCPMHIVKQATKHLETTIKANEGQGNKDWAALVAGQRLESGLKPFEQ